MKKILIVLIFMIVFLVGCGEPTPPEVEIDEIKVSEVSDSIDLLYSDLETVNPAYCFFNASTTSVAEE